MNTFEFMCGQEHSLVDVEARSVMNDTRPIYIARACVVRDQAVHPITSRAGGRIEFVGDTEAEAVRQPRAER
jgi:hypothetical protein